MKHVALSSAAVQAANSAKDVRDILLDVETALDSVEGTLDEEERKALDCVVGLAPQRRKGGRRSRRVGGKAHRAPDAMMRS